MTKFQAWYLRRIFRQEAKQGYLHDLRIQNLYGLIREAARNEFTEDNNVTLDTFLYEQFKRVHPWIVENV